MRSLWVGAGCKSGRVDSVWIHGVRSLLYVQCPVVRYGKVEVSGHVVMVLDQIYRRISCCCTIVYRSGCSQFHRQDSRLCRSGVRTPDESPRQAATAYFKV